MFALIYSCDWACAHISPSQGVGAARARAGTRRRTKRTVSSSSIQVIEEEESTRADMSPQLPTPRETPQPELQPHMPVISDTLFDFVDIPATAWNGNTHKTRTGTGGNPLMTVIDSQGVFEMEVLFCACPRSDSNDKQLLRAGLFPATFKQIETVFTFAVLDDFLADNLECKTTAQQYYSKLQSMTSSMFPDNVPVRSLSMSASYVNVPVKNRYRQLLRVSRQWRDLKNRMKSGLGHPSEQEDANDGSMAIFCPACPQPNINLPDGWKEKYSPYVITCYLPHSH
jgi:hypothetical protein